MAPHRLVHAQADEPAEQQVEVQLLHELPLAVQGEENLDEAGQQQPLRWDGGPPDGVIVPIELGIHTVEEAVHHNPDKPKRMADGLPALPGSHN